jgi:hypothetical protein
MRLTGRFSAIEGNCLTVSKVAIGSPRPRSAAQTMAGLLARGSLPHADLPGCPVVVTSVRLTAYSCGGSHGLGPSESRTVFPIILEDRSLKAPSPSTCGLDGEAVNAEPQSSLDLPLRESSHCVIFAAAAAPPTLIQDQARSTVAIWGWLNFMGGGDRPRSLP